jgi:hypothetical protein
MALLTSPDKIYDCHVILLLTSLYKSYDCHDMLLLTSPFDPCLILLICLLPTPIACFVIIDITSVLCCIFFLIIAALSTHFMCWHLGGTAELHDLSFCSGRATVLLELHDHL